MSVKSHIEWTMMTWNPVVGCSMISSGCAHCYAERMAARLKQIALANIAAGKNPGRNRYYIDAIDDDRRWSGKLIPVPEALTDPFTWSRPQLVFVNSMSDLFHETLPDLFVADVVRVMAHSPWHNYQVLTKRADRLQGILSGKLSTLAERPNIWWGVSVENRKQGLPRIAALRDTPAAIRFLSIEPLLEDLGEVDLRGIHWVIVGGESGPGAREMSESWVLSIRDQCQAAGVPFFFKQWGGTRKSATGRELQGKFHDAYPSYRFSPSPPLSWRRQLAAEFGHADQAS